VIRAWLVCGLRSSSLNLAARFARPVAICGRQALGLRSSRKCFPKSLTACGPATVPDPDASRVRTTSMHSRRLSHARSRPSRSLGSASRLNLPCEGWAHDTAGQEV
jgi:hypothetical protein